MKNTKINQPKIQHSEPPRDVYISTILTTDAGTDAVQGVHLQHEVPLPHPTKGRVTRHLSCRVEREKGMLTKQRVVECLSMYFHSDQRRANCFTLVQININLFDIVRDLKYPLRLCYSTKKVA